MTATYLRFDAASRDRITESGVPFDWLTSLFLGTTSGEHVPHFLDGITSSQKNFAIRQTVASGTTYVSLRLGYFECPDPWLVGSRCFANVCLTLDAPERLPYEILPLYYGCKSHTGEAFWICVYATYGQVTQIFFPDRQLVIFDISQSTAEAVVESLTSFLARHSRKVAGVVLAGIKRPRKLVGLLDMVTNFGHQAINHLSGIQRLIDLDLLRCLDEIWVSGVNFFGDIEILFPETKGKVRHFTDKRQIAEELLAAPIQVVRVGSTYLSTNLRRRILKQACLTQNRPKANLLVVTVRAQGRICVNLPEVVGAIHRSLSKSLDFKIAIDGFVLPQLPLVAASSLGVAISSRYLNAIRDEMALAEAIEKELPPRSISVNTIGRSMFESLRDLSCATAYFSHVGTLQHKLGLLLGIPGVVHGPKAQVINIEGGPYLSEEGIGPKFIPDRDIEDIPTVSIRGASFSDYRIVDVTSTIELLRGLML